MSLQLSSVFYIYSVSIYFYFYLFFYKGESLYLKITQYFTIIFSCPRIDRFPITLNKQIYPDEPKFFLSAHNQATNKSYGYIILDLNQNKREDLRVITGNFENEINVYLPVNSKKGH